MYIHIYILYIYIDTHIVCVRVCNHMSPIHATHRFPVPYPFVSDPPKDAKTDRNSLICVKTRRWLTHVRYICDIR